MFRYDWRDLKDFKDDVQVFVTASALPIGLKVKLRLFMEDGEVTLTILGNKQFCMCVYTHTYMGNKQNREIETEIKTEIDSILLLIQ